jgi:hypothetical protein
MVANLNATRKPAKSNPSWFQHGHKTWNAGLKGLHLNPETEYKKGRCSEKWLPIGSIRIRTHKSDGPRAWVKISDPNIWKLRAVLVWEENHGPLPKGMLVHHQDRNTMNDVPTNLQSLTRAEHAREHSRDRAAENPELAKQAHDDRENRRGI